MCTLENLKIINGIRILFKQHQILFEEFSDVYLFGSILYLDSIPNDIDILLVYNELSNKIIYNSELICSIVFEFSGLQTDMTILSHNEFEENYFLSRLGEKYLKIK